MYAEADSCYRQETDKQDLGGLLSSSYWLESQLA
jgi:hypothetical protein